jgi:hypothetical protein
MFAQLQRQLVPLKYGCLNRERDWHPQREREREKKKEREREKERERWTLEASRIVINVLSHNRL